MSLCVYTTKEYCVKISFKSVEFQWRYGLRKLKNMRNEKFEFKVRVSFLLSILMYLQFVIQYFVNCWSILIPFKLYQALIICCIWYLCFSVVFDELDCALEAFEKRRLSFALVWSKATVLWLRQNSCIIWINTNSSYVEALYSQAVYLLQYLLS